MSALSQVKFDSAAKIFAVSNTPSFLVRRLRADDSIREVAKRHSSSQILFELRKATKKKPKTLTDFVRPYALVLALSWFSNPAPLKEASKLKAPYYRWYEEIVCDLINRHSPVTYSDFEVAPKITVSQSTVR